MDRQDLITWIDQYLLDELKDEELSRFRQRLQTDAVLRQELEFQQALLRQARQVGRQALRQQLKGMHHRLELPWPVANPAAEYPAGAQQHGRPQARLQLRPKKFAKFFLYSLAASLALVMTVSLTWFFVFRSAPGPELARRGDPAITDPLRPERALVPLEGPEGTQNFGFGGARGKDTALAVLIYAGAPEVRYYRFDDTLRLYGAFAAGRLALRFDPKSAQYTLREDTAFYLLQRYQPRQPLQAISARAAR